MDLSEFQSLAQSTSHLRAGGPQGLVAPLLGLASETGSILDIYKKYVRDGCDLAASRTFLTEELGDLLWYAAVVAGALGLDLEDIAQLNLERTRDRYGNPDGRRRLEHLPAYDKKFPKNEQFPRHLILGFHEQLNSDRVTAAATLIAATPDAFSDRQETTKDADSVGYTVGQPLGDELTDNSWTPDAYRYHDAIHLGFMAVLGWSPNMRSLLRIKRKSCPRTDEIEDGARAIFAEEGLSAVLSQLAKRRGGFLAESNIDGEVMDVAKAATAGLEVSTTPGWVWRRAISHGFTAMHHLARNKGGYLIADLDRRTLTYEKLLIQERKSDDA